MPLSLDRKARYHKELSEYLDTYDKILVVGVDNVGSKQIQEIRKDLRGEAIIVMGKNVFYLNF